MNGSPTFRRGEVGRVRIDSAEIRRAGRLGTGARSSVLGESRRVRAAFTLIELMVVIAIIAIIMTMGVPLLRSALESRGINGAAKQVQEACAHARAQAILNDTMTELRIRPKDRMFEVGTASASSGGGVFSPSVSGEEWRMAGHSSRNAGRGAVANFSVTLAPNIMVEGLGISGLDYTEDDLAYIRFYPNGTSDEMTIVLLNDQNERRNIWLEVVTGLADFETDPQKFHAR